MEEKAKEWWEVTAGYFQDEADVPIAIHYGTGSPLEDKLGLIEQDLEGKKVLEMGCGAAQGGIAFAKKGAKVTGVDISEEQLEIATELIDEHGVDIELHQGDIKDMETIESSSYDIVYSAYAFQWLKDIQAVFSEAHRALKSGGMFLFSLPHPFFQFLGGEIETQQLDIEEHYLDADVSKTEQLEEDGEEYEMIIYRRTVGELFNSLREAGFQVDRIIEPDPREAAGDEGEQWVDQDLLSKVPSTVIFRAFKEE
ncbi:MAG: class I SAM-dependent methyltransferase [Candidatus Nanohalobium sp.]